MSQSNVLGTMIIDVVPNLNDLIADLKGQFENINFVSMGNQAGADFSSGVNTSLNLQDSVSNWVDAVVGMQKTGQRAGDTFRETGVVVQGVATHVRAFSEISDAFNMSTGAGLGAVRDAYGDVVRRMAELAVSAQIMGVKGAIVAAATDLWTTATEKLRIATDKLSKAMLKNPKILALAAIAGLVAGIVWLVDKTIGLRNIWEGLKIVFAPVGDAIGVVVNWIQNAVSAILENEAVMNGLKAVVMAILGPFGLLIGVLGSVGRSSEAVKLAQEEVERATDAYREATERLEGAQNSLHDSQNRLTNAQFAATDAQFAVEDAYARLQDVIYEYGEDSEEARRATHELDKAQHRLVEANERVEAATNEVSEAYEYQTEAAYDAEQAADGLSEANENLADVQDELERKTTMNWDSIKASISDAWASATEWMSGLGESARNMWSGAGEIASGIWGGITSSISGAWSSASGHFANFRARAQEMWAGVRERASEVWDGVANSILNILATLPSRLLSIGTDIIQGLVNGINNARERVRNAIRNVTNLIPSTVRNLLGINSPSRVFMKIGEGICEGLVIGLNSGLADVIKAVCNIADEITDVFETSATASFDALYSGASAGVDVIGTGSVGHRFQFDGTAPSQVTYENNFYTPTTGYHEVLAANRSAARVAARIR